MAANFWRSSHWDQWILHRQDLIRGRALDLTYMTEEEYKKILIFFCNFIQAVGQQIKLRQQVIATAIVYFKRFYARNSFKCVDPWLLAPTAILLGAKVEEFGVISYARIANICQKLVNDKFSYATTQEFPYQARHILECEFYLLESLDGSLYVYQPYRSLVQFAEEMGYVEELLEIAWHVVNDSLRTDVCLLYPPYQIALAGLVMSSVKKRKKTKSWFADLTVDMKIIHEICECILSFYDLARNYDEKQEIKEILAKMPTPNTQQNP